MGMGNEFANPFDAPYTYRNLTPRSYKLGWFTDYHEELRPSGGTLDWTGDLIGFVEKNSAGGADKMIVRIESDETDDVYIHFNRKIGFNSQSREGGDHVLVTSRPEGLGYGLSTRVAALTDGGVHTISNFEGSGKDLTITVNSITFGVPARASITIQYGVSSGSGRGGSDPEFVNTISYKHSEVENAAGWESRVGSYDVLDGANEEIQMYFDNYGITIDAADHVPLTGANAFDPDSSKLLNIPIDCTARDNSFIVTYAGVGRHPDQKQKPCSWFVGNNRKFCPLVDLDPNRAVTIPGTNEIVRPRIFQTCHQECDSYTHCSTFGS